MYFTGGVCSLEVCLHWRCVFTGGVSSLEVCVLLQGMACFYVSFKKNIIFFYYYYFFLCYHLGNMLQFKYVCVYVMCVHVSVSVYLYACVYV